MSSPSRSASSPSVAWASSPEPASRVSTPCSKSSRTGVLRSATSETRLTRLQERLRSGSRRSRANSVGNSAAVLRELALQQPGGGRGGRRPRSRSCPRRRRPRRARWRPSSPLVSDLAVSCRVFAGTSATAEMSGCSGFQSSSRTAKPVAVGGGQGDPVALDLDPDAGQHRQRVVAAGGDRGLATAAAKTSPETVPVAVGICGSAGYSSTGRVGRVNRERAADQLTRGRRWRSPPAGWAGCGRCRRAAGRRPGRCPAPRRPPPARPGPRPRSRSRTAPGCPPVPSAAGRPAPAPAASPGGCGPPRPPPPRGRHAPPGTSPVTASWILLSLLILIVRSALDIGASRLGSRCRRTV